MILFKCYKVYVHEKSVYSSIVVVSNNHWQAESPQLIHCSTCGEGVEVVLVSPKYSRPMCISMFNYLLRHLTRISFFKYGTNGV